LERNPKGGGGGAQWSKMGIFIGRLLGFVGARVGELEGGRRGCGAGGTQRPSGAQALQGGGHGAGAGLPSPPYPTASSRGTSQRERKKVGKEGADRLGPHGSETRRGFGGRWAAVEMGRKG
jgi:hypothetical protein